MAPSAPSRRPPRHRDEFSGFPSRDNGIPSHISFPHQMFMRIPQNQNRHVYDIVGHHAVASFACISERRAAKHAMPARSPSEASLHLAKVRTMTSYNRIRAASQIFCKLGGLKPLPAPGRGARAGAAGEAASRAEPQPSRIHGAPRRTAPLQTAVGLAATALGGHAHRGGAIGSGPWPRSRCPSPPPNTLSPSIFQVSHLKVYTQIRWQTTRGPWPSGLSATG